MTTSDAVWAVWRVVAAEARMAGDVEIGTSGRSGLDGLGVLAVEDLGVVAAKIAQILRWAG